MQYKYDHWELPKKSSSAVRMKSSSFLPSAIASDKQYSISCKVYSLKYTFLLGLFPRKYLLVMRHSIWSQSSSISGTLSRKQLIISVSLVLQQRIKLSTIFLICRYPKRAYALQTLQNSLQNGMESLQQRPTVLMAVLRSGKRREKWLRYRKSATCYYSACWLLFMSAEWQRSLMEGNLARQDLQLFSIWVTLSSFPQKMASGICSKAEQRISSQSDILMAHMMIVQSLITAASDVACCRWMSIWVRT